MDGLIAGVSGVALLVWDKLAMASDPGSGPGSTMLAVLAATGPHRGQLAYLLDAISSAQSGRSFKSLLCQEIFSNVFCTNDGNG